MNIKDSLLESTMLALQGKLTLNENRQIGKRANLNEDINVSIDDNNNTIVETEEATVIVTDMEKEAPSEETIEVPVTGDETIIPEEELEVPSEEVIEDEVINESKEHCADCDKENCECEKVEENKELKNEGIYDNSEPAEAIQKIYEDYCNQGMEENFWDDLINTTSITTDEIENWYKQSFEESKEIKTEDIEIEVSEDGNEVEVTVDEGEEVEVKDETSEDTEQSNIENEESTEEETSEEEIVDEEENEEIDEDSFSMALENYYKENMKMTKSFKVEKVEKNNENIKIEGKLTTKFGKDYNMVLEGKISSTGKLYTQYDIINDKILKESKNNLKVTMITKLKENKLSCIQIKGKSLIK